jgi:hypothetical protein
MTEPRIDTGDMRALWLAVIKTAMEDACLPSQGNSFVKPFEVDAARGWFRGGKDFNRVCALAGADPEMVQLAYRNAAGRPRKRTQFKRKAAGVA